MKKISKKLMCCSLTIYFILLIWVIIFKWTNYEAAEHSIITFRHLELHERILSIKPWVFTLDNIDLILNILLFLPLGLLYTFLLNKKYLVILIGLILTFVFEISQFFTCIGMFNFYDIIGNFVGCVLGYVIHLLLFRFISKKFINAVNIILIFLLSPVCIYAIIMTIINFNIYL